MASPPRVAEHHRNVALLGAGAGAIARGFALAIEAASAHVGATAPNPPVGCAALDAAGHVLAVDAHARAGTAHAEALVLDQCRAAGTLDRIATLLVTLEPCTHQGRTPPCTDAILAARIPQVVIGATDPNPKVSGGGLATLAERGVVVAALGAIGDPACAAVAMACRDLIAPFAKWLATGRPWVTVKQALDRDGGMIPPRGSKTFTSAASLTLAHVLRRQSDALLTGSGTILADAPDFTVRRVADHRGRRRPLMIVDRRRRTPPSYIREAATRGLDVRVVGSVIEALDLAGSQDALRLLVEAGPTLLPEILQDDRWDEHVVIRKGDAAEADTVSIVRRV